jgi:hypothetical protein
MANEQSLNYFHGALLDEDAEKLLVNDGDYLLQHRFDKGSSSLPKLFLSVKKKQVHRFEIKRASSTTYSLNVSCFFNCLISTLGQGFSGSENTDRALSEE